MIKHKRILQLSNINFIMIKLNSPHAKQLESLNKYLWRYSQDTSLSLVQAGLKKRKNAKAELILHI